MLSFRNINPLVRSIGTVGAVAALVGGVTFASGTGGTNVVSLTGDDITTTGSWLTVATPQNADTSPTCVGATPSTTGEITGLNFTGLDVGATSDPYYFCIGNEHTSPFPVNIGVSTEPVGTIPTSDVTLNVACGAGDTKTAASSTMDQMSVASPIIIDNSLASGSMDLCSITATINPDYNGPGGDVGTFKLDLQGRPTS